MPIQVFMMTEPIVIPEQKNYEYAYGLAYRLAAEKLAAQSNIELQCRRAAVSCSPGAVSQITLKYLNQDYSVRFPEIEISAAGGQKVELRDKILILHYLTRASGEALSGQLITYQELKEGANYFPSFYKRAVKPLIDTFGPLPDRLVELSGQLGGVRTALADAAVTIPAFPRVPVTLVLWKGDEEFPPNANILFDSTILDYLPVEDVNILCQTIIWQMVAKLREIQSKA